MDYEIMRDIYRYCGTKKGKLKRTILFCVYEIKNKNDNIDIY